jgi:hypothetical protein
MRVQTPALLLAGCSMEGLAAVLAITADLALYEQPRRHDCGYGITNIPDTCTAQPHQAGLN